MDSRQVSIRLPEEIREWLSWAVPPGVSQQHFLLSILRSAKDGQIKFSLFDDMFRRQPSDPPARVRFSFIDLFAGIGGFKIGLTRSGGRCVFTSEWNKFARKTYRAWFGEDENIAGDIMTIDIRNEIPGHDVLAAGFPCQPFSLAGVSKKNALGRKHGFDDEAQGNLFFKICEIVEIKRPPILFLENVKNLKSHDGGNTWRVIEQRLSGLGYRVFSKIIDARDWVPQHRERIFIVCFDTEIFPDDLNFEFPEPPDNAPNLGSILEPKPDPKYTLSEALWEYLRNYAEKHRSKGNGFGYGLVGPEDISRTLSARYHKDGSEILIKQEGNRPRRLTRLEAARLMGFTDELAREFGHPDGWPNVVSDTQGYRQLGNSVVPVVVEAISRKIVEKMAWLIDRRGEGCLVKGRFCPLRPGQNSRSATG